MAAAPKETININGVGSKCSSTANATEIKMIFADNGVGIPKDKVDKIFDMYYTRYKYHREIYNHKAVKSIELMIGDILLESNDVYNFPSILDSPEFIDLDDTITTRIRYNNELLTNPKELLQRIDSRDLYKRIYESSDNIECVKDYIEDTYPDKKKDDFHIIKMNFDFCNKEATPFSNIKFYNNKLESVDYKNINIRKLIPNNFRETSVVVYEK